MSMMAGVEAKKNAECVIASALHHALHYETMRRNERAAENCSPFTPGYSHTTSSQRDNVEVEIRLGRLRSRAPPPSGLNFESRQAYLQRLETQPRQFEAGVSWEYMFKVLSWMESCPAQFAPVGHGWRETNDYYYITNSMARMRTEVSFDDEVGVKHTRKERVCWVDCPAVVIGPVTDRHNVEVDMRIAVADETDIPSTLVPEIVIRPQSVRLKQRRSFLYTPSGETAPFIRYDFTVSWHGATFAEAEQNQHSGHGTTLEIELELLGLDYVRRRGIKYVAKSLLGKTQQLYRTQGEIIFHPLSMRFGRDQQGKDMQVRYFYNIGQDAAGEPHPPPQQQQHEQQQQSEKNEKAKSTVYFVDIDAEAQEEEEREEEVTANTSKSKAPKGVPAAIEIPCEAVAAAGAPLPSSTFPSLSTNSGRQKKKHGDKITIAMHHTATMKHPHDANVLVSVYGIPGTSLKDVAASSLANSAMPTALSNSGLFPCPAAVAVHPVTPTTANDSNGGADDDDNNKIEKVVHGSRKRGMGGLKYAHKNGDGDGDGCPSRRPPTTKKTTPTAGGSVKGGLQSLQRWMCSMDDTVHQTAVAEEAVPKAAVKSTAAKPAVAKTHVTTELPAWARFDAMCKPVRGSRTSKKKPAKGAVTTTTVKKQRANGKKRPRVDSSLNKKRAKRPRMEYELADDDAEDAEPTPATIAAAAPPAAISRSRRVRTTVSYIDFDDDDGEADDDNENSKEPLPTKKNKRPMPKLKVVDVDSDDDDDENDDVDDHDDEGEEEEEEEEEGEEDEGNSDDYEEEEEEEDDDDDDDENEDDDDDDDFDEYDSQADDDDDDEDNDDDGDHDGGDDAMADDDLADADDDDDILSSDNDSDAGGSSEDEAPKKGRGRGPPRGGTSIRRVRVQAQAKAARASSAKSTTATARRTPTVARQPSQNSGGQGRRRPKDVSSKRTKSGGK